MRLILIALLLPVSALASVDDAKSFLEDTYATDRPGASVIIMKDGEILHQAGYGLANVEWGIPITPDTVFRVGSVTKQFTGAAIMLLEQRGLLSVDDPIEKHLPDYPTHGHVITIEMLLNHTSGIKSYTSIDGYMDQAIRTDLTTDELIDVFKNQPMDFAPGDDWRYNNSGYVLLGAIIEEVSGQSYEAFIADNIAAPLDLSDTYYGGPKLIPNRASGYRMGEDGNIENAAFLSMTQPHAAGSLLSTTGDLAIWHKALTSGEFIHDDSYEMMTSVANLNNGETFPYGYGLGIGQLRSRDMISHGGGIHGFTCYSLYLPDEDLYVAVLTNGATGAPGPGTIARKIAAMTVGDPYPDRVPTALGDADLAGLAGTYVGDEFPPVELSVVEGEIHMSFNGSPADVLLAESRELLFEEGAIDYIEVEWEGPQARRLMFHFEEGAPPEIAERAEE